MNHTIQHKNIFSRASYYMAKMPVDKRLAAILPDVRIIRLTKIATKFMPPLACLTLVWGYIMSEQWGPAVATALFAFSLPIQGLLWLGARANKPLPPALSHWCEHIQHSLNQQHIAFNIPASPFTYFDLANVLNLSVKHFGDDILNEL